jgi:hypothetical protein
VIAASECREPSGNRALDTTEVARREDAAFGPVVLTGRDLARSAEGRKFGKDRTSAPRRICSLPKALRANAG